MMRSAIKPFLYHNGLAAVVGLLLLISIVIAGEEAGLELPAIPDAQAEIKALVDKLESGQHATMEWEELAARIGIKTLDILAVVPDLRKYERGAEHGLRTVLGHFSPSRIIAHVNGLPDENRMQTLQVLDRFGFHAPETTRHQMIIFFGLKQDQRALFFSRRYWSVTHSPQALQYAAMAIRRSGERDQDIWGLAGQRLFREGGRGTRRLCQELSFYIGLAEELGQPLVVPHLIQIAAPHRADPELGRLIADQLFRLGFNDEAQTILSGASDPVLIFHMLRLLNEPLKRDLPEADWQTIIDTAASESDVFALAAAVEFYNPTRAAAIRGKVLNMSPENSRYDAMVSLTQAISAEVTGRYKQAAAAYENYIQIARVATHMPEQRQEALSARAAVLRQMSEPDIGLLERALQDQQQGRIEPALESLRQARARYPDLVPIHLRLVQLLAEDGPHEAYRDAARKLLTLSPLPGDDRIRWAEYAIDSGETKDVDVLLATLSEIEVGTSRAVMVHARLALIRDDLTGARRLFKEALEMDPPQNIRLWLGLTDAIDQELEAANAHWDEHLLAINPIDDRTRRLLFLLRSRQGQEDHDAYREYLLARGNRMPAWEQRLAAFALDDTGSETLVAITENRAQSAELAFVMAWKAALAKDVEAARVHFQKVVDADLAMLPEYLWARAELKRLLNE